MKIGIMGSGEVGVSLATGLARHGHAVLISSRTPAKLSQIRDAPPTMFICGNDADAKAQVIALLESIGWEAADMGAVEAARAIEPLSVLWCIPGFLRTSGPTRSSCCERE